MKPGPFRLNKEDAATKLAQGGVLILPTDTIVGLHCRADLAQAVARIKSLKARDAERPLLLLASGLDQVALLADSLSAAQASFCRACWPGPFTLVLRARYDIPVHLTAGLATVAIRIPAWDSLRDLIELVGYPLVSTSANCSGEPPCEDLQQAADLFGEGVDGIWQEKPDVPTNQAASRPSALIDISTWPPRILRSGPLPAPDWEPVGGS